jgi:1-acyl-sn-glycerol-3-phosphate acyltransferase
MHEGVAVAGGNVSEREQSQPARAGSARKRAGVPTYSWARTPPARLVRSGIQYGALVPLLKFISPFTVIGKRNLSKLDSPAVFVANHQSHFDAPICLAALGGRVRRRPRR